MISMVSTLDVGLTRIEGSEFEQRRLSPGRFVLCFGTRNFTLVVLLRWISEFRKLLGQPNKFLGDPGMD